MLATPSELNLDEIRKTIREQPGIHDVHHMHLWPVSESDLHFEGHITVEDQLLSQVSLLRGQIEIVLLDKFDINHTTLQF
ncbi:MAG TPA: hypothetical protein ENI97_05850 [Gammaproteobacteria bacterium]|nr:hypothetical protein [Gammaproteobacteria bacterium]